MVDDYMGNRLSNILEMITMHKLENPISEAVPREDRWLH